MGAAAASMSLKPLSSIPDLTRPCSPLQPG